MTGRGRPIRFLVLATLGWFGARVLVVLWQPALPSEQAAVVATAEASPPALPPPQRIAQQFTNITLPIAVTRQAFVSRASARDVAPFPTDLPFFRYHTPHYSSLPPARLVPPAVDLVHLQAPKLARLLSYEGETALDVTALSMPNSQEQMPTLASPWSVSAWLAARGGSQVSAAPGGGQLGGSQAGVRVAYVLSSRAGVAAFARITSPLRGRGREAAAGLEWQFSRAPLRVVAERRFGLNGVPGGPGLALIGGLDQYVAESTRVEAYGQAGAIHRVRLEPYADGAVRIMRDAGELGRVRLSLGAGAWGGAQRGAARLDVGPTATLAIPLAGKSVRLAADWRQRVAGDARPGSGPALTLGMDF